jgi:hypothetical protein
MAERTSDPMSAADTAPDPKKAQVKGENTADVGMDPGASSVDYEKELEDRFDGFLLRISRVLTSMARKDRSRLLG